MSGVCTVIFVSNPTTVLRLCYVVIGVATKDIFYPRPDPWVNVEIFLVLTVISTHSG